jgi:hypothetical protein
MVFKNIYRYRTATATAVAARQRSHRHGHLWCQYIVKLFDQKSSRK